ncbi:hypothetical protein GK109_08740 [Pseudarthrobacter sp. GA104]|nr:hypothetical protein [Pseudarthrobacter sp. GA104]
MVPRRTAGRRPPACRDVLTPTCNRPAELAVTLAGLAAQAEPAFAVVISDQSTGSRGCEVWLPRSVRSAAAICSTLPAG